MLAHLQCYQGTRIRTVVCSVDLRRRRSNGLLKHNFRGMIYHLYDDIPSVR